MEYVRWNSFYPEVEPFTREEKLDFIINHVHLDKQVLLAQDKNSEIELSNWYIHTTSKGGFLEDKGLSFWQLGDFTESPTHYYKDIKKMYENDNWSALGYENITQIQILRSVVEKWLEVVESN